MEYHEIVKKKEREPICELVEKKAICKTVDATVSVENKWKKNLYVCTFICV